MIYDSMIYCVVAYENSLYRFIAWGASAGNHIVAVCQNPITWERTWIEEEDIKLIIKLKCNANTFESRVRGFFWNNDAYRQWLLLQRMQ